MSSFLDFIEQEPNTLQISSIKKNEIANIDNINEDDIADVDEVDEIFSNKFENKKDKFSFNKNEKKIKEINNPNHNTFNEFFFKKGDFIKIIRSPRKYNVDEHGNIQILEKHIRLCDIYCGYIGEIRQFFKGDDSAMVFLHASNHIQVIKFPIECIIKID
jgi:hypothetical protein